MSKQCLDVQQMQHLQELGLKLKPSLVHYYKIINIDSGKWYLSVTTGDISEDSPTYQYIPAYTLQDVLDALTRWEINDGVCPRITIDLSERLIRYHYKDKERVGMVMKSFDGNGTGCLIDAVYEMLCWAIEKKFVKTDKNKLE